MYVYVNMCRCIYSFRCTHFIFMCVGILSACISMCSICMPGALGIKTGAGPLAARTRFWSSAPTTLITEPSL